jgi:hypothetical protein
LTARKRLDVRVSPFVDLYLYVFKLAAGEGKAPDVEGFGAAVEAARAFPAFDSLARLGFEVSEFEHAADLQQPFSKLPESVSVYTREGTRPLAAREKALQLGKALAAVEKPFLEKIWPRHKAMVEEAAGRVAKNLVPKEQECFAYIIKSLGMEDVDYTVPVYLVAEAPRPGGFTTYKGERTAVCFVAVEEAKGSLIYETVLHEAIHALDIATAGGQNALVELRGRLQKAGVAARDPDMRNVPHTIMFIQAAETVRRVVDPAHKHYGEVAGYYAKVPLVAKIELPLWTAYLDNKISREEAVTRIVEEFLAARKGKTTTPPQPR